MTAIALNPPLRTIRLYGLAGKLFGRVHRFALDSNSVAEAVQALASQIPGFSAYLMQAKDKGVGFAVFAGKQNLTQDELAHPVGDEDIRIAPVILGSKNGGIFSIVLGAALIAASFIPLFAPIAPALMNAGIAMVVGGVVQMLAPQPKGLASKDSAANTPSYAFSGPVNTEAQGHPVPVLYGGPLWVGSAVISAGIDSEETAAAYQPPAANTGHMGYGGDLYGTRVQVQ